MDKVIHFLPSLTTGGAPINVLRLIKLQHKKKSSIQHVVCSPFDNFDMQNKFIDEGIELIEMPAVRRFLSLYKFLARLYIVNKMFNRGSTIGVLHGRGCGFLVKPFLILINVDTIHFYRGYTPDYGLKNRFKAFLIRRFDKFLGKFGTCIAVGFDEANLVQKFLKPRKLCIIRNPVPKIEWEKGVSQFDFGFVGRRSLQKGFDRALYICRQNPDLKFAWVGDCEGQQFQNIVVPNNLKLIRYLPQTKIFESIKVLICLSRWEGCSTVISECVKSEKPFLSVYCSGVSEFRVSNLNDKSFFSSTEKLSNELPQIDIGKLADNAIRIKLHFESELSIKTNLKKWDDLTS